MENLIKQMRGRYSRVEQEKRDTSVRVRFSGVEQEKISETENIRDRRIPLQKTQSFKGDKKKSWFSRQFSRQMNEKYDYSASDEYQTALAAATFAIKSLEDSRNQAQIKADGGPDNTSTNITSKSEDKTTKRSVSRTESKKIPATKETLPRKVTDPEGSIKRIPTTADTPLNSIPNVESKNAEQEKPVVSAPSIKKSPTLADKTLNSTATAKPENTLPKPLTFPPTEITRQGKPGFGNTKADVWEKTELAKINDRYEKLNASILDWEKKKKTKAKRKMDKIEGELERRRAKSMQRYRTKMDMIDQIAHGARAKAEKNRRNEEVQVKEKANKIRSTGKYPATCLCF